MSPPPNVDAKKWQKSERRRKQKIRLLHEQLFDSTLKLFLSQDQVEKIHDFEEECMESLAREKEYQSSRTNDERLYRTCERSEQLLQRVNDIVIKDDAMKENMRSLDSRIEIVEAKQVNTKSITVFFSIDAHARQFFRQFFEINFVVKKTIKVRF